jgi:leader peptidase (prepilin peptidase)/N-methyltransferase
MKGHDILFNLFISIELFIFGACLGSFLNCVIVRIRNKQNWTTQKSHCDNCQVTLKWFDLIPIFSFLLQKGKCRYCKTAIPASCLLSELITAAGFCSAYLFRNKFDLFLMLIGLSALIISSIYDINFKEVPYKFTVTPIALTVTYEVIRIIFFNKQILIQNLITGAGIFIIFYIISRIKQDSIGGADILLFTEMGFILGSLYLSAFMALTGIVGILIYITEKACKKEFLTNGKEIALIPSMFISFAVILMLFPLYSHLYI